MQKMLAEDTLWHVDGVWDNSRDRENQQEWQIWVMSWQWSTTLPV